MCKGHMCALLYMDYESVLRCGQIIESIIKGENFEVVSKTGRKKWLTFTSLQLGGSQMTYLVHVTSELAVIYVQGTFARHIGPTAAAVASCIHMQAHLRTNIHGKMPGCGAARRGSRVSCHKDIFSFPPHLFMISYSALFHCFLFLFLFLFHSRQ